MDVVPTESWAALEVARSALGLSTERLWIGYFALGGNGSQAEVAEWVSGIPAPNRLEYDLLAQAVNDEAVSRGLRQPLRYEDA